MRGDFVGCAELEVAAHARVHAFRVLADDREINIVRRSVFQGTERFVEQANRANVCVQIHLEAHAQQNFLGMNVGRHARIAQRPNEYSVEVARQHVESVRRDGGAVDEVSVSAPVERGELSVAPEARNTSRALGMTSLPTPSPGTTATRLLWATGHDDNECGWQVANGDS